MELYNCFWIHPNYCVRIRTSSVLHTEYFTARLLFWAYGSDILDTSIWYIIVYYLFRYLKLLITILVKDAKFPAWKNASILCLFIIYLRVINRTIWCISIDIIKMNSMCCERANLRLLHLLCKMQSIPRWRCESLRTTLKHTRTTREPHVRHARTTRNVFSILAVYQYEKN